MANNRNKRSSSSSICEMSMLLVANIIRLSSLRFTSRHHDEIGNTTNSVGKIINSNSNNKLLLQQPEFNPKKPRSYLMKPGKEEEDPTTTTFVRPDLKDDDVNVNADKFIKKTRAKIINGKPNNATAATPKPFSSKPCSSSPSPSIYI